MPEEDWTTTRSLSPGPKDAGTRADVDLRRESRLGGACSPTSLSQDGSGSGARGRGLRALDGPGGDQSGTRDGLDYHDVTITRGSPPHRDSEWPADSDRGRLAGHRCWQTRALPATDPSQARQRGTSQARARWAPAQGRTGSAAAGEARTSGRPRCQWTVRWEVSGRGTTGPESVSPAAHSRGTGAVTL